MSRLPDILFSTGQKIKCFNEIAYLSFVNFLFHFADPPPYQLHTFFMH
jgi:hypothetical protein